MQVHSTIESDGSNWSVADVDEFSDENVDQNVVEMLNSLKNVYLKRTNKLKKKTDKLAERLDGVEDDYEAMNDRADNLAVDIGGNKDNITAMQSSIENLKLETGLIDARPSEYKLIQYATFHNQEVRTYTLARQNSIKQGRINIDILRPNTHIVNPDSDADQIRVDYKKIEDDINAKINSATLKIELFGATAIKKGNGKFRVNASLKGPVDKRERKHSQTLLIIGRSTRGCSESG